MTRYGTNKCGRRATKTVESDLGSIAEPDEHVKWLVSDTSENERLPDLSFEPLKLGDSALRRSELWEPDSWIDADKRPNAAAMVKDHAAIDVPAEVIEQALAQDLDATL